MNLWLLRDYKLLRIVKKTKDMKNKPFVEAIKSYLDRRASEDKMFAESYANPNKSISECCNFIMSEVRKQNRTAMTDDEVYGLAVHYYDEENIKVSTNIPTCKVVVPELKEKERKIRELAARKRKRREDKMEQPTLF